MISAIANEIAPDFMTESLKTIKHNSRLIIGRNDKSVIMLILLEFLHVLIDGKTCIAQV